VGRHVHADRLKRRSANEADRRRYAAELVALAPDVILASNSQATLALQAAHPDDLVDQLVRDPSGSGRSESLTVRR